MIKLINTKAQKMSAAIITGAMVGSFGDIGQAFANSHNLDIYLQRTSDKTNSIPDAVAFISYLGGTALAALGVVNLKQHVENPSQTPMKNGLAKLGFGGMLLALPTITGVMQATTADTGQANYGGFTGVQMGN